MSKNYWLVSGLLALLSPLAAQEYQLKFNRARVVSPQEYPECIQGLGRTDDLEGHPCLVIDQNYTNPVVIRTPKFLPQSAQGSIKFYYRPNLPAVPKNKKLAIHSLLYSRNRQGNTVSIGINKYPSGETICYFLICNPKSKLKNYGPYRKYKLIPLRWHRFEISWDKEQMMLIIDGNLVQARPLKGQVAWGKFINISGRPKGYPPAAPGLISHITFADQPVKFSGNIPLVMKQKVPHTPRELQRLKDTRQGFFFFYESPQSAVSITVKPNIFQFKKGDRLWIEQTDGKSYELLATKDQELTLKSAPTLFNQVMISHTVPNMAQKLDFKLAELTTDIAKFNDYALWREPGRALGQSAQAVTVTTPASGNVRVGRSAAIPVAPGQRYIASCHYYSQQMQEGNRVYFGIQVRDQRGRSFSRRAFNVRRNNMRDGVNLVLRFDVPKSYQNPQCRIMAGASGKPFQVTLKEFDLRPLPHTMYKIPRPITFEQRIPQLTAGEVRQMLQQRTPAVPGYQLLNGRNVFTLNGKPQPFLTHFASPSMWDCRQFEEDGFPIQHLYVKAASGFHRFWMGANKYDFKALDNFLETSLCYAPKTHFMLVLCHDPYYGYASEFPNSVSRNPAGEKLLYAWRPGQETPDNPYTIFYLSPDYLRDVRNMIRALCAHLQKSPYGKAVIGVHITGGYDGQWFPVYAVDRSPDSLKVFRSYLKMIYKNDLAAFRQAWGDAKLTFDTANFVPGVSGTSRYFLSPDLPADRRAMDMYNYRSWCTSEVISRLAKVYKDEMKRPFFVSSYYNDSRASNDCSKDRLLKILTDKNIDSISSCIPYGDTRNPGATGHSLNHAGSVELHHKKWRMEIDYRTDYSHYTARGAGGYDFNLIGATRGHAEHWDILARDLGFVLSANQGGWFYGIAGQAWGDSEFHRQIRRGFQAAQIANQGAYTDRPPLAIFLDDNTSCYSHVGRFSWDLDRLNFHYMQYLATTGLGYQSYELGDLLHPELPKYKVYVFARTPHLSEKQIQFIEKNLQKDGNILIFSFDAARLTGQMVRNIQRLTGIKVKAELNQTVKYQPLPGAVPSRLGRSMEFFTQYIVAPLMYVADPTAEKVAVFKTRPDLTAAAVKRHKNWTAVYSAFPQGVTAEFISLLAREQKVPATAAWGDVVHKGNNMIVLHALHSGKKTIHWERPADLWDVATGQTVARQVKSYSFELEAGRSRWFILK